MRTLFLFTLLFTSASVDAQSYLPGSFINNNYRSNGIANINFNDSASKKKWFISKYSGLSTTFSFFRGGNATVISAPLGLQLNRRLNNNVYAFAGVSIAPAYVNFRSSFLRDNYKSNINNQFKADAFAAYSRAELGMMYVNDGRTISISGSIGIEKQSSIPLFGQFDRATQTNNLLFYKK